MEKIVDLLASCETESQIEAVDFHQIRQNAHSMVENYNDIISDHEEQDQKSSLSRSSSFNLLSTTGFMKQRAQFVHLNSSINLPIHKTILEKSKPQENLEGHCVTNGTSITNGPNSRNRNSAIQQQLADYTIYADQVNKYKAELSNSKSELFKTQLKKEALETEIELLENQIRLKRKEICTNGNEEYENCSCSNDGSNKMAYSASKNSHEEIVKLMNEKDTLKHKLYFERTHRDLERKELESQVYQLKDEWCREQKMYKEKVARLEEELRVVKNKCQDVNMEKEELNAKLASLENKLMCLQQEVCKRDRDSYSSVMAENTEKHLTNLCQTLNNQLEDVKSQLKLTEEKCKRYEFEQSAKQDKIENYAIQLDNMKKELELSNDSYHKMKKTYEEQITSQMAKEKEIIDYNDRLLKEKDVELFELRNQLNEAKHYKMQSQQMHEALCYDFKKNIAKHEDEIKRLEDAIKAKQAQFETFQREFEIAIGPKVEERIKHEKMMWEQDQSFLIRKELAKLNDEKCKEIAKIHDELNQEREKYLIERDRSSKLEKQIEELQQEIKFANKEKVIAVNKTKEAVRMEIDKIRNEAYNDKQDEICRYKKIIKELEEEIESLRIDLHKSFEKEREFMCNIEKMEKCLIKELNEEQRRLSNLIPGLVPKLTNYSNGKNSESSLALSTFQIAFANLKNLLDQVTQSYQSLRGENEQIKRNIAKSIQDKDEEVESVKRQYEKQKQKELETIREYIAKDQENINNYTNEIANLVNALRNKDREIQEIQENMSCWKKETLNKLAEKFEVELNKELDRRMQDYKMETSNQQIQLDKLRKEMDCLVKEYKHSNQNNISQEQHERIVRYLQSRLNDLRDENLTLRERYKSSSFVQPQSNLNSSKCCSNIIDSSMPGSGDYAPPPPVGLNTTTSTCLTVGVNATNQHHHMHHHHQQNGVHHHHDDLSLGPSGVAGMMTPSLYTPSIDGDARLESKNELLQQKLNELQKLQMQLNSVHS